MSGNKFFKRYNLLLSLMVVAAVVLTGSCNKNTNEYTSFQPGIDASKQFVFTQQMMAQLMNTYFKCMTDSALFETGKSYIDRANVFYSDEAVQNIRIVYPKWGIEDGYGHYRAGTISAYTLSGFHEEGADIFIHFDSFRYDFDTLVIDTMNLKNMGRIDGKHLQYSVSAQNMELIYGDSSGVYNYAMNQVFKVYKAAGTVYTSPADSIGIFGDLGGINKDNIEFLASCSEDSLMLSAYSCHWLKQGVVEVDTKGFEYVSTVFFPEPDTCANLFLIEIDGNPFAYPAEEHKY